MHYLELLLHVRKKLVGKNLFVELFQLLNVNSQSTLVILVTNVIGSNPVKLFSVQAYAAYLLEVRSHCIQWGILLHLQECNLPSLNFASITANMLLEFRGVYSTGGMQKF